MESYRLDFQMQHLAKLPHDPTKKPLLPDIPVQGHGCRDSYQKRYSGKNSHRLFNGRSDLVKPFSRKLDGHWVHKQPVHDRG